MKHHLHIAEERRFPIDPLRGPLYDEMRGQYAIWTELGYGTGVIVERPGRDGTYQLVICPYMYGADDIAVAKAMLAAGQRMMLQLPARDLEQSQAVAGAFGLEVRDIEFPGTVPSFGGLEPAIGARPAGTPEHSIAAYAYDSRALLTESDGCRHHC